MGDGLPSTMKYHYSYCFLTYLIKWNVYFSIAIIWIYLLYFMVFCFDTSFLIKILRVCYIDQTNIVNYYMISSDFIWYSNYIWYDSNTPV